jgi:hypothetical protein
MGPIEDTAGDLPLNILEGRMQDSILQTHMQHYLSLSLDELLVEGQFRTDFEDETEALAYDVASLVASRILVVDNRADVYIGDMSDVDGYAMHWFDSRDSHSTKLLKRAEENAEEILFFNDHDLDHYGRKSLLAERNITEVPALQINRFSKAVSTYLNYTVNIEGRNIKHVDMAHSPVNETIDLLDGLLSYRATNTKTKSSIGEKCPPSLEYLMLDRTDIDSTIDITPLYHLVGFVASETCIDGRLETPENLVVLDVSGGAELDGLHLGDAMEYFVADVWQLDGSITGPAHLVRRLQDYESARVTMCKEEGPYKIEDPAGADTINYEGKITLGSTVVVGGSPTRSTHHSIESQIAQIFPDTDPSLLVPVITQLEGAHIHYVTDQTCSDAVFDSMVTEEGRTFRMYGKTGDKRKNRAEAQDHRNAWTRPLLRPITPKVKDLIETETSSTLITYGTENIGIFSKEDEDAYVKLRDKAITAYAIKMEMNPAVAKGDMYLIDIFNTALRHTEMKEFVTSGDYTERNLITPFDLLLEEASATSLRDPYDVLRTLETTYGEAAKRLQDLRKEQDPAEWGIVNPDARPANIFTGIHRPMGDSGSVTLGYSYQALSRMEREDDTCAVGPHFFFREYIEREEYGRNIVFEQPAHDALKGAIRCDGLIRNARILTFSLATNNQPESARYANLTQLRQLQLKQ